MGLRPNVFSGAVVLRNLGACCITWRRQPGGRPHQDWPFVTSGEPARCVPKWDIPNWTVAPESPLADTTEVPLAAYVVRRVSRGAMRSGHSQLPPVPTTASVIGEWHSSLGQTSDAPAMPRVIHTDRAHAWPDHRASSPSGSYRKAPRDSPIRSPVATQAVSTYVKQCGSYVHRVLF
jgi:hypothetical protein